MTFDVIEREAAVSDDDAAWLLRRGVRGLLRADEAEVVEGIARYVMSQHASLRGGSALMERARGTPLPRFAAALGALNRFLEVSPEAPTREGVVWVARLGNERRAIEPFIKLLPELNWTELKFRRRPRADALSALARAPSRGWRKTASLARGLHRRHEFFKVLRAAELVGYYARYLDIFRRSRFRLAVMSSHSNPHGVAFNLAARRCGVPVALVTHGMPVRPVAPLSYDLALVHCEAARRVYEEAGSRAGRVLVQGRRERHAPVREGPPPERASVGLFLCKDVNEGRLRSLAGRLLSDARVSRVVVRPHPKNLWRGLGEWVASDGGRGLSLSAGGPASGDAGEVDFVLAGNSSVLVDAVVAGRPAAYVEGIDHGPRDMHEFVARGLVCEFDDVRGFDPEMMTSFYRRPEWQSSLRLFANVDEDEAAVAERAAEEMRALASRGWRAGEGS